MNLVIFTQAMAAMTASTNNLALYTRVMNQVANTVRDDEPCMDEAMALLDCVGETCLTCIVDALEDFDESTTCADLKASTFCDDITSCAVGSCSHLATCEAQGKALETCVEAAYPEAEGEPDPDCEGLCETEAHVVEQKPAEVFSKALAVVAATNSNYALYSRVSAAVTEGEEPCMDEAMTLLECVGEGCLTCIFEAVADFDEDTTCDDLKNSDFCTDIFACAAGSCSHLETCESQAKAFETCAEAAYPDMEGQADEECVGLCETESIFRIA